MSFNKVKYSEFDPARIIFGKPEKKQGPNGPDGKPIEYFIIDIKYMYEITTPDGRKSQSKGELYIEGPKEKSRKPPCKEYAEKGKVVHTMFTKYDLANPDHERFIMRSNTNPGTIHSLCMKCCDYVFDNGKEVGINNCFSTEMMMGLLHYPVKWSLEKGLPVPGENPGAFWKLFRYGSVGKTRETTFYLPGDGTKTLPWEMLENCSIEHQPLFKVNNITIAGGRPSVKIDLYSSVVFDILPGGSANVQSDTLAEASKDSMQVAKLMEKIRELEAQVPRRPTTPTPPAVETASTEIPGLAPAPAPAPVKEPEPNLASVINSGVMTTPSLPGLSLPGLSLPGL